MFGKNQDPGFFEQKASVINRIGGVASGALIGIGMVEFDTLPGRLAGIAGVVCGVKVAIPEIRAAVDDLNAFLDENSVGALDIPEDAVKIPGIVL